MRLGDWITATGIVLVAGIGFGAGVVKRMNEADRRVRCATQLRQIGQGMLLYSNENRQAYPRTTYDMTTADKPVWGTPYEQDPSLTGVRTQQVDPFTTDGTPIAKFRPAANDVSAAFFLLLRTQDINTDMFICPSTFRAAFDFGGTGTALSWTNWKGIAGLRDHLTYSVQNPYGLKDAVSSGWKWNANLGPEYAIVADMNPGSDELLKVTSNSDATTLRAVNSQNHGGDGQNILFGDGHVEFLATPFVGSQRDNIYTYGPSGTDKPDAGGTGIIGSAISPNDSILLPTAASLKQEAVNADPAVADVVAKSRPQPIAPDAEKTVWDTIVGEYTDGRARNARMLAITPGQATLGGSGLGDGEKFEMKLTAAAAGDSGDLRVTFKRMTGQQETSSTAISVGPTDILIIGSRSMDGRWYRRGHEPVEAPRNSNRNKK